MKPPRKRKQETKPRTARKPKFVSKCSLNWEEFTDPYPQNTPVFQESTGPNVNLDEGSSALDFFKLFFTDDLMRLIKTETNRYANSSIATLRRKNKISRRSVWNDWTTVKMNELYSFFGIIIHMSVVKKPKISDYWSKNGILDSSLCPSIMKRDRFRSILSMLHLNNNNNFIPKNNPGHDPLFKLRSFWDQFLEVSINSFLPNEKLCIDEAMCPFRGRVSFRVYNKDKPEKYGVKMYAVTDAVTGYVLCGEIYTGKVENSDGTIASIFDRVCGKFYNKGHTIYMDRFYSSPTLFNMLFEKKTLAVGTVQKNRKEMPKDLVNQVLSRDQMTYRRCGPLLCIKWHDKRDVFILSTKHQFSLTAVKVRTKGGRKWKIKPEAVNDYNFHKTGVDHIDQLVSYYPFHRKTVKWWKKVFFHLFTMSIANAHILYKKIKCSNLSLSNFMIDVSQLLIQHAGKVLQEDRNTTAASCSRLIGRHFPSRIESEKKKHPARRCKVCTDKVKHAQKIVRKETVFKCTQCDIPLCLPECFTIFHTKSQYYL